MFVDSHCHAFDDKIDFKISELKEVDKLIVCAYSMSNLSKCLDFCKCRKKCLCALGVHPEYVDDFNEKLFADFVEKNLKHIVAIGEIGLDCTYQTDYEKQKRVFEFQLKLAEKMNLPVSVHLRTKKDYESFFEIKEKHKDVKCALHCFLGDEDDLLKAVKLNCWFSFAGNITYKRNVKLRNIIKLVPIDRLLIETDCPGMLPSIFGKRGVNISKNIIFVAEKVAECLAKTLDDVANITTKNACEIFDFGRN